MSEIKGQLLGIILVIAIFGVVLGVLTTAFQHSAETIQNRVEDAAYINTSKPTVNSNERPHNNYDLVY